MLLYSIFLLFLCSHFSTALYSSSDDVIELTSSNFDTVLNSNDLWIIEFYAPWCGHCQQLAPEWKKAATALKGVVKIGAVDMDQHGSVGQPYNIKGFPTIKVFAGNKRSPKEFQGDRNAQSIVNAALREVEELVRSRLTGGGSRDRTYEKRSDDKDDSGSGQVVELTDSNFDELVLKSDEPWLVEFFAPWCGHCKTLKPHWDQAASELKGKVKLGALDATVYTSAASRFGVQGYPTIKFFPAGVKSGDAQEFDGGRTSADIVRWAMDKVVEQLPPPEIKEILNQDKLKSACEEHQLCVVAVVPNILDCQSNCRNAYLNILQVAGDKYKTNQWGWCWTDAMKHPELEQAFGIGGFGYPALVVVNVRKLKYATLTGPFSEVGIQEFVRDVSLGRGATATIHGNGLPIIKDVEPWDGKDGEVPVEEEIDLSELGIGEPKSEL